MFEYRWEIPGRPTRDIALRVYSKRGWLGRKVISIDGQAIVKRSRFQGVFCRFPDPTGGNRLEMRLIPVDGGRIWRPGLFRDGQEIPQAGGTPPPVVPQPPALLASSAAIVYVLLLMAVVCYLPITQILEALYVNRHDVRLVLNVRDLNAAPAALRVDSANLPPIRAGETLAVQLAASGGAPPYTWMREKRGWSPGLELDPQTGRLSASPSEPRSLAGAVKVCDAEGREASGAVAVRVLPTEPPASGTLRIATTSLPPATVGAAYEAALSATGGRPAPGESQVVHKWAVMGKAGLPAGLELDEDTGVIRGTPKQPDSGVVALRVADLSYQPIQTLLPWVVPALVTAVCLVGYLQMQREAVVLFGLALAGQAAVWWLGLWPLSPAGLAIEAALWLMGAVHYRNMR